MSYTYRVLQNDPEEMKCEVEILREVFTKDTRFTFSYLKWLYVDNPNGPAIGFNAYSSSGELAAHYVTIPVRAELKGKECLGVLSLNTATRAQHQGKGLFTELANRTYEEATRRGCEFVMGIANSNSTPGFTRKLGFKLVAPLEARIGLGFPSFSYSKANSILFRRKWDNQSLAWRLSRPDFKYSLHAVGRSFVTCNSGIPFTKALLFNSNEMDLSNMMNDSEKYSAVLTPFTLFIGLNPNLEVALPPFINIPQKLRPSPLNFILRPLGSTNTEISAEQVLIQSIDFDAF